MFSNFSLNPSPTSLNRNSASFHLLFFCATNLLHAYSLTCRFEGVSWNEVEDSIAYIAEECSHPRPLFGQDGSASTHNRKLPYDDVAGTWKGQGDWLEDWGEYYTGKRRPVIFVANITRCVVVLGAAASPS